MNFQNAIISRYSEIFAKVFKTFISIIYIYINIETEFVIKHVDNIYYPTKTLHDTNYRVIVLEKVAFFIYFLTKLRQKVIILDYLVRLVTTENNSLRRFYKF